MLNGKEERTSTRAIDRLIDYIESANPSLTSGVATYLSGCGDFTDGIGVRHRLRAIRFPNEEGDFGQVDENNHYVYESLSAPALAIGNDH